MAQKKYERFTITEREILFKGLAQNKLQKEIAEELNRNPSTISREIRRTGLNRLSYCPSEAKLDVTKQSLKRKRRQKIIQNEFLCTWIEDKLKIKWSPEQISAILKIEFPNELKNNVSHETIYRYIYSIKDSDHKKILIKALRQSRKKRKPKKKGKKKGTTIKDLVSIHNRPPEVETRQELGHWEGDLVIGKDHKSAIGTLVERSTGYLIIVSFTGNHNTYNVTRGFAAALGWLPSHMKRSLTYDRGTEMAGHKWFSKFTGIPVYFADPYCSWQRGTNENTNGLIRDYFPKKTDFSLVTNLELFKTQESLNSRPRKRLEYDTPEELFTWFVHNPNQVINDFYATRYKLVT